MAKVLVHTGERGSRIENPLEYAGYSVVKLSGEPRTKGLKFFQLARLMKREHPDLIIVDSAGLMCLAGYALSRLFRIPYIIRMRADIWTIYQEQKEYRGFFRQWYDYLLLIICESVLKRCESIFSISEYLKTVIENHGVDREKIKVVQVSIDSSRFYPGQKMESAVCIVSVSNLNFKGKTQGLLEVLPAIDDILSDNTKAYYTIAGRGRFAHLVEETIANLRNKDRILYAGFVENVEHLYQRADIFVHYSFLDAFPIAVLEAMAAGLPVIAYNHGGVSEQVRMTAGILVDDMQSLKGNLIDLIEDEERRKDLGQRGRSLVLDRFTLASTAESYRREIEALLRDR